ncbi:MAG: cyclic nucleotide-binding domain-containing protein [Actinomycetota bacterium]|nr:cyclic nucleotide-binding domain-containing protein [Actinomycetota bacterium]
MAAAIEALKAVPLFAGLEESEFRLLERALKERRFEQGAVVTREGASGVGFFVIAEGKASVSVGGEPRATLGPGDYFGEVALFDEGARTASITAETDLRCFGLTSWQFRPFVLEHPEVAWKLLQGLARRLRSAQAPVGTSS